MKLATVSFLRREDKTVFRFVIPALFPASERASAPCNDSYGVEISGGAIIAPTKWLLGAYRDPSFTSTKQILVTLAHQIASRNGKQVA